VVTAVEDFNASFGYRFVLFFNPSMKPATSAMLRLRHMLAE
jgi:hypothetical protein